MLSEQKLGFVSAFLEQPGDRELDCLKVVVVVVGFMLDVFISAQGVFGMMLFFIRNVHTLKTVVLFSLQLTYKIQIPPNK